MDALIWCLVLGLGFGLGFGGLLYDAITKARNGEWDSGWRRSAGGYELTVLAEPALRRTATSCCCGPRRQAAIPADYYSWRCAEARAAVEAQTPHMQT